MLEMLNSGARKTIFDKQFQELAINEIQSSMSKSAMVDRVKKFLPKIDAKKITEKGTAGIRSSVIDKNGKFVPDVILKSDEMSFHILNYNSPGPHSRSGCGRCMRLPDSLGITRGHPACPLAAR